MTTAVPFGPSGEIVYNRTYSRTKEGGGKETWPDTVRRVAKGNLALVHGRDATKWDATTVQEYYRLVHYMDQMALLPAGRHLWATGVANREYLFNCHVSGWGESFADHFEFTFLRLMEGGGVGSNYSMKHLSRFGAPRRKVNLGITCRDENHKDIEELRPHLNERSLWYYGGDVEDSREGWAYALRELIEFHFEGFRSDEDAPWKAPDDYPLQFDVSGVRPSGSPLKTFGGTASGPAPFAAMMNKVNDILNAAHDRGFLTPMDAMEIDHAIAECVVSGGNRRSARMAIVAWDDPYVFDFLRCKQDTGLHWTTNISVEIDDRFLATMGYHGTQAWDVHQLVVKGMLENGEPGYWNSSLSNHGEVEQVIATNPCGEIALQAWENCNLGHVNMDYFHDKTQDELVEAHQLMTRFLVRATFGDVNDPGQREVLHRNRRIGVGHLGVQGFWAKKGVAYTEIPKHAPAQLKFLYQVVSDSAVQIAHELRIPVPVKKTALAPTGSVAKLYGATESAQALHSKWFEQRIRFSKRDEAQFATVLEAMNKGFKVEDDVYDKSGMTAVVVYPTEHILLSQVRALGIDESVVQSQDELTVEDMLKVQAVYQTYWADNAVSYTVNIPEGSVDTDELAEVLESYLPVLKGTTVMVDASRPQSPYTRITREEYEAAIATAIADDTDLECATGACPVR